MSMVPPFCDILSTVGFSKSEAYPVRYKKASSLFKGFVAGYNHRSVFIALADESEKQSRCLLGKLKVADLVDLC
jgi:hypothetical protein